jgi:sugar/nucleoside kinase (ribokinase family)
LNARLPAVDFLVIGHLCKDVAPAGYRLGGTGAYAAIMARNLGLRAGILTRAAADLPTAGALDGIALVTLPSSATTTFENIYVGGQRVQRLLARGDALRVADTPAAWRGAPIVLLGPLAQELEPAFARAFPTALVGVSPQGWMRAWDEAGRVTSRPQLWRQVDMRGARVVVVSEEDIAGEPAILDYLIASIPIVVLTAGWKGATLFMDGQSHVVPPRPAREVDPTGAGDVFAAAFLVRLSEIGDPVAAARFANVAASLSVEAVGQAGIPTRAGVLAWLAQA